MADDFQKRLNAFALIFVGVAMIAALAMVMTADLDDFKIHYGEISQDQATEFFQKTNALSKNQHFQNYIHKQSLTHSNKSLKKHAAIKTALYPEFQTHVNDFKDFAQDEQRYNTYMNQVWTLFQQGSMNEGQITLDNFQNKLKEFGMNEKQIQKFRGIFDLADMNHSGFVGRAEWINFSEIVRDTLLQKYELLKGEKSIYKMLDSDELNEAVLTNYHLIAPSPL